MTTDKQDTGSTGNAPQDAGREPQDAGGTPQGADATPQDAGHGPEIVAEGELSSEQVLERAVLYAFEQGRQMLEEGGEFEPFTILIDGEELYIEEHPGTSEEESYASARRTVYQMERICTAYVFCYDGYIDLDDGANDALVVEFANKGDAQAQIIVVMYHRHGDHYHFNDTFYQVGEASTLFGGSPDGSPGDDADVGDADGDARDAGASDGANADGDGAGADADDGAYADGDGVGDGADADDGAYADGDGDADADGATGAEGDPADAPRNRKPGKSFAVDPISGAPYGAADVAIAAVDVAASAAAGVGRTAGKLGIEAAANAILDGLL
jgi:hypothetical protein